MALVLFEFDLPVLTLQCHLVSVAAFARLFFANFDEDQRLMTALTVLPVLFSHYYLWTRTHKRFYLYTAAVLAAVLPRFEMGRVFTATAWAALTVALLYAGRRWKIQDLCWQSYALAAMAFGRCWSANFYSPEMFAGFAGPVLIGATVIGCLYAAQMLSDLDGRPRLFYSVLASLLLAVLLYYQISGSLLTVAWERKEPRSSLPASPARPRVAPLRHGFAAVLHPQGVPLGYAALARLAVDLLSDGAGPDPVGRVVGLHTIPRRSDWPRPAEPAIPPLDLGLDGKNATRGVV